MVSAGPSGALVRRTARSNSGSKKTVVALYALLPTDDLRVARSLAGHHVRVGGDETLAHDEARSLLLVAAGHAEDLDRREDRGVGQAPRLARSVGVETSGVDGGVSVEKTCGKPWSLRKVCRSPKTEGAGRMLSIEWRMSERLTAASSEVKRLLGEEIDRGDQPDGDQHGHHGHAHAQGGVHVAQVVPAHADHWSRSRAPGPRSRTRRRSS